MKPSKAYLPADALVPFRGINTLVPSTMLAPGFSPSVENINFRNGLVEKREGYRALGTAPSTDPVIGIVEWEDREGTKHLVVATTQTLYSLNVATETWTDLLSLA